MALAPGLQSAKSRTLYERETGVGAHYTTGLLSVTIWSQFTLLHVLHSGKVNINAGQQHTSQDVQILHPY